MKLFLTVFTLFAACVCFLEIEPAVAEDKSIYTHKVGELSLTLLSEGQSERDTSILIGVSEEALKRYAPNGKYAMAANAFLIRTGRHLILVDTGYGRDLFKNLKQVGVDPKEIDTVLITHMHGDHIGGLLSGDLTAFPNATLYLPREEHDYWTHPQRLSEVGPDKQQPFLNATRSVAAYGDRLHHFSPQQMGRAEELLPFVKAIATPGHTPGHTSYLIESNGERLLIWGDMTHAMAIQIPHPEIAVTYDSNPELAIRTRKEILSYVSENKIAVAGMHIPYPGMGTIEGTAETGFTFIPFQEK